MQAVFFFCWAVCGRLRFQVLKQAVCSSVVKQYGLGHLRSVNVRFGILCCHVYGMFFIYLCVYVYILYGSLIPFKT